MSVTPKPKRCNNRVGRVAMPTLGMAKHAHDDKNENCRECLPPAARTVAERQTFYCEEVGKSRIVKLPKR